MTVPAVAWRLFQRLSGLTPTTNSCLTAGGAAGHDGVDEKNAMRDAMIGVGVASGIQQVVYGIQIGVATAAGGGLGAPIVAGINAGLYWAGYGYAMHELHNGVFKSDALALADDGTDAGRDDALHVSGADAAKSMEEMAGSAEACRACAPREYGPACSSTPRLTRSARALKRSARARAPPGRRLHTGTRREPQRAIAAPTSRANVSATFP